MQILQPSGIHPPIGENYSHGVLVGPSQRLLFVAGQVGIAPDGSTVLEPQAQFDQAWDNVMRVLEHAGMTARNIVKVNCFLADERYREHHRMSCAKFLGAHRPAMTAVIVRQLWTSDWLVEVDVVAAG